MDETTVETTQAIGTYVKAVFDFTDGFVVFGLPLTYWLAICLLISAFGIIVRGNKS